MENSEKTTYVTIVSRLEARSTSTMCQVTELIKDYVITQVFIRFRTNKKLPSTQPVGSKWPPEGCLIYASRYTFPGTTITCRRATGAPPIRATSSYSTPCKRHLVWFSGGVCFSRTKKLSGKARKGNHLRHSLLDSIFFLPPPTHTHTHRHKHHSKAIIFGYARLYSFMF